MIAAAPTTHAPAPGEAELTPGEAESPARLLALLKASPHGVTSAQAVKAGITGVAAACRALAVAGEPVKAELEEAWVWDTERRRNRRRVWMVYRLADADAPGLAAMEAGSALRGSGRNAAKVRLAPRPLSRAPQPEELREAALTAHAHRIAPHSAELTEQISTDRYGSQTRGHIMARRDRVKVLYAKGVRTVMAIARAINASKQTATADLQALGLTPQGLPRGYKPADPAPIDARVWPLLEQGIKVAEITRRLEISRFMIDSSKGRWHAAIRRMREKSEEREAES